MFRRSLAGAFILVTSVGAQDLNIKSALRTSLEGIDTQLTRIEHDQPTGLPDSYFGNARRAIRWLGQATDKWNASDPGEGEEMLAALQSISDTLRTAAPDEASLLVADISKDLAIKADHCRARGLTDRPVVKVTPKRPGVGAVPDLKVLYVPKYRAHRPDTEPKLFEKRSTPAEHRMTPGNYVIWAAEANNSRTGTRQLVEIIGTMARSIDVDAP